MSKPQAVPENLVCSECGLEWSLHPDNPRRRDCIELLKRHYPNPAPIIWTNSYCSLGHYGCTNTHYQYNWIDNSFSISSNFIISNDDDPDMGVPAIVS